MKDTAKSFVLDSEAVAYDKTEKKILAFQELSRRKRKDVKVEDIQVRVCLFAFDLLYLNGEVCLTVHCRLRKLTGTAVTATPIIFGTSETATGALRRGRRRVCLCQSFRLRDRGRDPNLLGGER